MPAPYPIATAALPSFGPAATRTSDASPTLRRIPMAFGLPAFEFPEKVNEYAARTVASVVTITLSVAAILGAWWLVPVLAVGFLLRVGWGPKFSPLAKFGMWFAPKLFEVKPVSGAPKRFAQGIGAACTVAASILFASGLAVAGWAIVGMVMVFAFLEATVAFCMGCWIYARLQAVGVFPPDACVDCAPAGSKFGAAN